MIFCNWVSNPWITCPVIFFNLKNSKQMIQTASAFFVITSEGRWGRGLTIGDAMSAAGSLDTKEKKIAYSVVILLFKYGTDDATISKIITFYCVNSWGNISQCMDLEDEDLALIKEHQIGYSYTNNSVQHEAYWEKKSKAKK
jgi:hypothetical protein